MKESRMVFARITGKLICIALFSIVSLVCEAQDFYKNWDPEIIRKANTAAGSELLTDEERELILLTNLVRTDGPRFTQNILLPYLEGKKSTRYTRSLIRDLERIKDLEILHPEKDLILVADEHAEISGKRGTTGHQRFDSRYGPLLGKYSEIAENCAYGYVSAADILIQLLIDEDIPSLGHRKNLLNPAFNAIGVSIHPHKKYRYNCVMSFGKKVK
jgi:hypothetical protein